MFSAGTVISMSNGFENMDSSETYVFDFSRLFALMILYEGPIHGYGLIQKFKERTGKELSPSMVYPFLKQLEEKAYVDQESLMVGQKEKKVFKLTDDGRLFCESLFQRFAALVTTAIEPSLEVCASCGVKIYDRGHKETIDGQELSFCCVHCAASSKQSRA